MTLSEAIKKSVETRDLRMMEAVVNQMRDMGADYEQCAAKFKKFAGIDKGDFEVFMYEIDMLEAI